MIAFKCKMCGGELNIADGSNICECEFCGTQQTIPTADNEKKVNLFNRANRLRMNAEFDKAATVYASITAEFPEEAEAYWGLCLSKYGIEYVDDPLTGNKIPTCHRTLTTSIMDDSDFDQACENADPESKRLYREEAKTIDKLQQDILSIVASEEPFDVFICYKETDNEGNRTEDSVLAQDIYDSLTSKGLKVFFARITLEDKLGKQYEPYIYAALHSAKVMLAVGTQYDYFDAVWVKNEWARYLDMMKTDKSKTLIPCFKGIDAYDMPREFKNLQAQDMGKIGWLQDLIRGIIKLTTTEEKVSQQNIPQYMIPSGANIENLMKRARLFMEDGEFENAREYLDKVLDEDAEYAPAYVAKVCISQGFHREEDLCEAKVVFTNNPDWKKAIRFATQEQKKTYQGYEASILVRMIKNNYKEYEKAEQCEAAIGLLTPYSEYEDVFVLIEELEKKKEVMSLYEEKSQNASVEIESLKRKYNNDIQVYRNKRSDMKSRHQKEIIEIQKQIDSCKEILRELTSEEIKATKGLFSGKKKQELYNKRVNERKRIEELSEQCANLEREYNRNLQMLEKEQPDKQKLMFNIARLYYDFGLYEEAAITFYGIINYDDVKSFVNSDSEILAAVARLKAKAVKNAPASAKQSFKYVEQNSIEREKRGYCSKEVDEFLTEIVMKSFVLLDPEEKAKTIQAIRRKEFNEENNGYSKKVVQEIIKDVLYICYQNEFGIEERQFVNSIKPVNSMIEICRIWEHTELNAKYPTVNSFIQKKKEQERLYGRLRYIETEKTEIAKMLGL